MGWALFGLWPRRPFGPSTRIWVNLYFLAAKLKLAPWLYYLLARLGPTKSFGLSQSFWALLLLPH